MGRPCEFDEAEVIERAMLAFWRGGYDGTALPDLLRETGIGRQSLYGRFGDKRGLFLRCLRRYQEMRLSWLRERLCDRRPVGAAFASLFEVAAAAEDDQKRMGCLAVNTVMEL